MGCEETDNVVIRYTLQHRKSFQKHNLFAELLMKMFSLENGDRFNAINILVSLFKDHILTLYLYFLSGLKALSAFRYKVPNTEYQKINASIKD